LSDIVFHPARIYVIGRESLSNFSISNFR